MTPFRSESQRKWMYKNYPKMAKRWSAETPKNKPLPKRLRRGTTKKKGSKAL